MVYLILTMICTVAVYSRPLSIYSFIHARWSDERDDRVTEVFYYNN